MTRGGIIRRPWRRGAAYLALILAAAPVREVTAADGGALTLSVTDMGGGTLSVDARFTAKAPRAVAWEALTDYDKISTFISSIKSSTVKARANGVVLLEQEANAKVWIFEHTVKVSLSVIEHKPDRIQFMDILRQDFDHYAGSWELRETGPFVELRYQLQVKRSGLLADLLMKSATEANAKTLMAEMRDEIQRRSNPKGAAKRTEANRSDPRD